MMGRPPLYAQAMTPAERKARSRALQLGALAGQLQRAEQLAKDWQKAMRHDGDIAAAFQEIAAIIGHAALNIPKS